MRNLSANSRKKSAVLGVTGLVSLLAAALISMSAIGATPLSGSGANVVWTAGTAGSTTGTGAFVCGTTVGLTMASGFSNSGQGVPINWGTTPATNDAFTEGISPVGAVAIHGTTAGVLTTLEFGIEVADPILLVNYIDGLSSMTFTPTTNLTLLDWNSSLSGAVPTVANGVISLETNADTGNDGWAVRVSGTYGPTSGPLSFTFATQPEATAAFSVALPSGTECVPATTTTTTTAPAPEPVPTRFTG